MHTVHGFLAYFCSFFFVFYYLLLLSCPFYSSSAALFSLSSCSNHTFTHYERIKKRKEQEQRQQERKTQPRPLRRTGRIPKHHRGTSKHAAPCRHVATPPPPLPPPPRRPPFPARARPAQWPRGGGASGQAHSRSRAAWRRVGQAQPAAVRAGPHAPGGGCHGRRDGCALVGQPRTLLRAKKKKKKERKKCGTEDC